jgi:formylmethanofuran dehydrogenase subunit E
VGAVLGLAATLALAGGCAASTPCAGAPVATAPAASSSSTPVTTSASEGAHVDHKELYRRAGTIVIRDPRATMSGTAKSDAIELSLEDVGLFTGHTCGCDTAGFLITKHVLATLYGSETPSRGTLAISISEFNPDLIDAVAFITGARLNRGEYTGGKSDLVVDPSIAGAAGTTTLIFERKDNGKRIKAVIDRGALLTKDEMRVATVVKGKILKGLASDEEKEEFARTTQAIVRKEITALPEGAFVYTPLN